jgi:hypothetical protein
MATSGGKSDGVHDTPRTTGGRLRSGRETGRSLSLAAVAVKVNAVMAAVIRR